MTKKTLDELILAEPYQMTGPLKIHVEQVVKKWSHLWFLSQYKEQYRLVKMLRKDSDITVVKMTIHEEQAQDLIKELSLVPLRSSLFAHGTTWRKEENHLGGDKPFMKTRKQS